MTGTDEGIFVILTNLVNKKEGELREYWKDIFLAEDNDPSFEDAELEIADYVDDKSDNRKLLHLALRKSLDDEELASELPEGIRRIASCEPVDYKINATELEIRVSLLLAMSSLKEAKRSLSVQDVKNSIAWFGHVSFWAGVHVAAYSAQQRDWQRLDKAAEARRRTDPKQAAKQNVRDCWEVWRQKPEQYKSKSAFARAMLDKYEELGSQRVIERWCKEWESEPS